MIRFSCPGCGAEYTVKDDKAGKSGKCPTCETAFTIPGGEAPPAAALVPRPSTRPKVSVQVQADDEEEDRPLRRRVARDEDDDEEYDEPPRRKKRRKKRRDDGDGEDKPFLVQYRSTFRIISGIMSLLSGTMNILCGIGTMIMGGFVMSLFGVAASQTPSNAPNNPAQNMLLAGGGVLTAMMVGCGVCLILFACIYLMAGVGALSRKPYGRIMTIIVGVFSVLHALGSLYRVFESLIGGNIGGFIVMSAFVVYAVIHSLTSFFACFGPGAEREFRG